MMYMNYTAVKTATVLDKLSKIKSGNSELYYLDTVLAVRSKSEYSESIERLCRDGFRSLVAIRLSLIHTAAS